MVSFLILVIPVSFFAWVVYSLWNMGGIFPKIRCKKLVGKTFAEKKYDPKTDTYSYTVKERVIAIKDGRIYVEFPSGYVANFACDTYLCHLNTRDIVEVSNEQVTTKNNQTVVNITQNNTTTITAPRNYEPQIGDIYVSYNGDKYVVDVETKQLVENEKDQTRYEVVAIKDDTVYMIATTIGFLTNNKIQVPTSYSIESVKYSLKNGSWQILKTATNADDIIKNLEWS